MTTVGIEIEWADIDKSIDIPAEVGFWEGPKIDGHYMGSEPDIVNTKGVWRGVCTDPIAVNCPVGGEIHTVPSKYSEVQLYRYLILAKLFPEIGVSPVSHLHVHVGIPETYLNDKAVMEKFVKYVRSNERDFIELTHGWTTQIEQRLSSFCSRGTIEYLKYDGGRSINEQAYEKFSEEHFDAFLNYPAVNVDMVTGKVEESAGTHYRTAINLSNLAKGKTVEFRSYRATLNPLEVLSVVEASKAFVEEGLGEGKLLFKTICKARNFQFPKLEVDRDLILGWETTVEPYGRGDIFKKVSGKYLPANDIVEFGRDINLEDLINKCSHHIREVK